MYHTTGLRKDQILYVCEQVKRWAAEHAESPWPPSLGLFTAVLITLTYLRRNRVQAEIAEAYGTSQPTVSRAIGALTPVVAVILKEFVPTADDLDEDTQYLVDGTLLPTWSWKCKPTLYSGKHKTTGMNVQVFATYSGRLAWVSDPIDGHHHDAHCLTASGALTDSMPPAVADKGYVGLNTITPKKKPVHRELRDDEKNVNKQINAIRAAVEHAIAHLKTWRILHTDYRRPIDTFSETLTAVLGLYFYSTA